MGEHRRPKHHFRRVGDVLVEVNKGVEYVDDKSAVAPSSRLRSTLGNASRQMEENEPLPVDEVPEYTADVLMSKVGDPYRIELDGDMYKVTQIHHVHGGVGEITFAAHKDPDDPSAKPAIFNLQVGPGMKLVRDVEAINIDLRRAHIPGLRSEVPVLMMASFAEANMDGAVFGSPKRNISRIVSVCMDGASLRDAYFGDVVMRNVSLVGVDATGARFDVAQLVDVDITDSNIHPDQFVHDGDPVRYLYYREHSLQEVVDATGLPADELAVRIWAEDIEVRDNSTRKKVTGFLDGLHHIPQWEMQRLLREVNGETP
jgi:hypothetical protein